MFDTRSTPRLASFAIGDIVMIQKLNLTANVWREDDMFIAQCLEFDVASQGDTVEKALANLREAVELYLEPPAATIMPELHQFGVEVRAA
jgi:predicted RNase H-like HicB family nuclease